MTTGALIPLGASQDVATPTFKLASLASIMRCRAPPVCAFNSWAGPDSSLPPRATTMASASIKCNGSCVIAVAMVSKSSY